MLKIEKLTECKDKRDGNLRRCILLAEIILCEFFLNVFLSIIFEKHALKKPLSLGGNILISIST